jgi:jumonji domain-containing protein 2
MVRLNLIQFWKTIKYTPPIYGADLHGSFMCDKAKSWNLGKLDSLLTDAAPVLIKGVTYPYVYVGTWKSIFCWHKEDLDLAAINYLH